MQMHTMNKLQMWSNGFLLCGIDIVLSVPPKAYKMYLPEKATSQNDYISNSRPNPKTTSKCRISCVSCADNRRCILKAPCGHTYCKSCLRTMFQMALKDRSRLPVRCCNISFDQSWYQRVLDGDDQDVFAGALEEMQCKNKIYW